MKPPFIDGNMVHSFVEQVHTNIIHHIWFQGVDKVPEPYHTNMRQCARMNHNWKHNVWSGDMLRKECYTFSNACGRMFDEYEIMHQKIDLGRYVVVCRYGGISLDGDAVCLRRLSEMPFSKRKITVTSFDLTWVERVVSGLALNNATIYSPYPNHPSMIRLVDQIVARGSGKHMSNHIWRVNQTTGPSAFQKIVESLPDVEIASGKLFEPCVVNDCNSDSNTFIEHRHTGTWLDGVPNLIRLTYGRVRPFGRMIGTALMITFLIVFAILSVEQVRKLL